MGALNINTNDQVICPLIVCDNNMLDMDTRQWHHEAWFSYESVEKPTWKITILPKPQEFEIYKTFLIQDFFSQSKEK